MTKKLANLIDKHNRVTILISSNVKGDSIPVALGIYTLLKNSRKQVEVVNYGKSLPIQLDFLSYFSKIKKTIDYNDSLIIYCGIQNIDLLSFDLNERTIVNLEHQKNTINDVYSSYFIYKLFKEIYPISKEVATCFYTALLAETQYFTAMNVSEDTFVFASELMAYNIDAKEIVTNLKQRYSLASLRILSSTLSTLELENSGEFAFLYVSREKILESGAIMIDMLGIIEHAIALTTVKLACLFIELEDSIHVLIQSKKINISQLATTFDTHGSRYAVDFEIKNIEQESLLLKIKEEIKRIGILDA